MSNNETPMTDAELAAAQAEAEAAQAAADAAAARARLASAQVERARAEAAERAQTEAAEGGPQTQEPKAMIAVRLINNDGGGWAKDVQVEDGTTVEQLFAAEIKGAASNYLIRVNRAPVTSSQRLVAGDRISITPSKVEGA